MIQKKFILFTVSTLFTALFLNACSTSTSKVSTTNPETISVTDATPQKKKQRPSWLAEHTIYASEDYAEYQKVFIPYPAKDSVEEKKDFEILTQYQKNRSEKDCKAAVKERTADPKSFVDGLKHKLDTKTFETISPLLHTVRSDSDVIVHYFKELYNRPRPPLVNKELKPCAELPDTGSYPSGHAAIGIALSETLKDIFGKKNQKDYEHRGYEFGEHRPMSGVHYPSDVAMGRILALKIMNNIRQNPKYQMELKTIRTKLKTK